MSYKFTKNKLGKFGVFYTLRPYSRYCERNLTHVFPPVETDEDRLKCVIKQGYSTNNQHCGRVKVAGNYVTVFSELLGDFVLLDEFNIILSEQIEMTDEENEAVGNAIKDKFITRALNAFNPNGRYPNVINPTKEKVAWINLQTDTRIPIELAKEILADPRLSASDTTAEDLRAIFNKHANDTRAIWVRDPNTGKYNKELKPVDKTTIARRILQDVVMTKLYRRPSFMKVWKLQSAMNGLTKRFQNIVVDDNVGVGLVRKVRGTKEVRIDRILD